MGGGGLVAPPAAAPGDQQLGQEPKPADDDQNPAEQREVIRCVGDQRHVQAGGEDHDTGHESHSATSGPSAYVASPARVVPPRSGSPRSASTAWKSCGRSRPVSPTVNQATFEA